jgi:hypothetical protein
MGYVPESAKWYLAEIIEHITVEGDPRNVIHTNLVLVRADSPEEAHQKPLFWGLLAKVSYENPDGKCVTCRFRGRLGLGRVCNQEIRGLKGRTWCLPTGHSVHGPDYRARDVVEKMFEQFRNLSPIPVASQIRDSLPFAL